MPLPTWSCALMLAPAMALLVTIIAIPFYTLQWKVQRLPSCAGSAIRSRSTPPLPLPLCCHHELLLLSCLRQDLIF